MGSNEAVESLSLPKLAVMPRTNFHNEVLVVTYVLLSRRKPDSQVLAHMLANTGQRWHVRAYYRANKRFSEIEVARMGGDCSRDFDLSATEFALALANREFLEPICSSALAPGWGSHAS